MRTRLVTIIGFMGLVASIVAAATIWLTFTAPATVAHAVDSRQMSPLIQAVLGVIAEALKEIVRYL